MIQFKYGSELRLLSIISLNTPAGNIIFYVLKMLTPFLFCIQNIIKLSLFLRNIISKVV